MLPFLLLGCSGAPAHQAHPARDDSADGDSDDTVDPAETGDTGDTAPAPFGLAGPDVIPMPYVSVGEPAGSASFAITATGDAGSPGTLSVQIEGPFVVELDTGALSPGESRAGTITSTAATSAPAITSGTLTVTTGDQSLSIDLAAVVGDADIPSASTWESDDWGSCTTLDLPSAPFPYGSASYTDSSVKICVPTGLSDRGNLGVVTHFHGFNATIDEVDAYQQIHPQVALSGRDAILILPQGPVEASDGDFGRLDTANGLSNLVRDAISVLYRDGVVSRPFVGPVALTSHSGGYNVTANAIEVGGLPITAVHLFDSVYGDESTFANYAEGGGTLRSSYTSGGGTDDNNLYLATTLRNAGVDVNTTFTDDVLRQGPVTIGFIDSAHGDTLSDDRSYARWLTTSGIPRRPTAAPELLYTTSSGGDSTVKWRSDGEFAAVVEGSDDGFTWVTLATTTHANATVPAHTFLRVRADEPGAEPSDRYGATGGQWLIVDGFDRIFGGSWTAPTHDFAARLGDALAANGATFSVACNEAVAEGDVHLADYDHVLWLLGDESTADRTFEDRERTAIEEYISAGGTFVATGSEIGYGTGSWLSSTLHASYVSDSAGTSHVEGWTMGVTYPEDYPDVLSGEQTLWSYATGGAAAVGWHGRVVVIGFAIETLDQPDRESAIADLLGWLG